MANVIIKPEQFAAIADWVNTDPSISPAAIEIVAWLDGKLSVTQGDSRCEVSDVEFGVVILNDDEQGIMRYDRT